MSTFPALQFEPLPGYTIVERIGSGGYGEVYRVDAPGGLTKAMKIVHGYVDERRAKEELKALGRIKEVRHPFLLSLERIEVVEGRLIVVMELAEASLKDVFNDFVHGQGSGIPRDQLLDYLRDAADALDYLCKSHALQHLDVKPENLLLLAGHVKVGDFGMVKDLANTGVSLVAGLTPYYASPEVFRGSPTRYSDQYSLAVLYQQMLTGEFPFSGVTAAEIAQHHLNDEPELSCLPAGDRSVLARALSKSPERRYANCRDMVEALRQAGRGMQTGQGDSAGVDWLDDRSQSTEPPKPAVQQATQLILTEDVIRPALDETAVELPALPEPESVAITLDDATAELELTPTVFVGIGGTAARILGHLRRRTLGRFGNPARVPAFKTLLLDTDPKTLADAGQSSGRCHIPVEDTMVLPLRRPQDYREARSQHLRWISRRWLYNIPRSLRTDGIRPLGRLAFIDHLQQAAQRIRQLLNQVTDEESVKRSQEHAGVTFKPRSVRVYVIASISGGTGSGIVLDVAYALRHLLDTVDLTGVEVCGVLTHSTSRIARSGELAKINAYSWLTEFNHFNRVGGSYAGDPSCGRLLAATDARAFDRSYIAHLGNRLSDAEFDAAADAVAEFIYQDSVTPAHRFFTACHEHESAADRDSSTQASLRAFGVSWRSAIEESLVNRAVTDVCRLVVSQWLGPLQDESRSSASPPRRPSPSTQSDDPTANATQTGEEFIAQASLTAQDLASVAAGMVAAELGASEQEFFDRLAMKARLNGSDKPNLAIADAVDSVFWGPLGEEEENDGDAGILGNRHETIVEPCAIQLSQRIRDWITAELEIDAPRLTAAMMAAELVEAHFRRAENDMTSATSKVARDAISARQAMFAEADRSCRKSSSRSAFAYFQVRLSHAGFAAAKRLIQKLRSDLRTLREDLLEAGRDVRAWLEIVSTPTGAGHRPADAPPPRNDNGEGSVEKLIEAGKDELVVEAGRQFQREFVESHGGILELLAAGPKLRKSAIEALRAIVRRRVTEVINSVDLLERIVKDDGVADTTALFDRLLKEAESSAIRFGKRKHHLLVLPNSAHSTQLKSATSNYGERASCVEAWQYAVVACCDAGPLSLVHLGSEIIDGRPDYADFARRVHTRNDVRFSALVESGLARSVP